MTTLPHDASPATLRTAALDLGVDATLTLDVHEPAAGDATGTVLLLHGGGGPRTVASFAALLAERAGVRVLAPTHPGFAGTPRPERLDSARALAAAYVAALGRLGADDVTVIGNSFGGWVAAEVALLGDPRVRAAVLVDAVGALVPDHPVADLRGLAPVEIAALSWHDPSRAPVPPSPAPGAAGTGSLADAPAGPSPDLRALLAYTGPEMADPTLLDRLADVTIPVHVVWGESDRIVDADHGRALAAAIPGATFALVPRAGHLPQLEAPEALLEALRCVW